jgi:diketogulonate reductase-like aldo/keto reductase
MEQIFIPIPHTPEARLPALGLGTSQLANCAEVVAAALQCGYRHIDTAWRYGTEPAVGEGLRASRIPRAEVFLVTKVSQEYLNEADVRRSLDESLRRLHVDYVDLLLVHWPSVTRVPLAETMGAFARAKAEGVTRHIGVANFNIALLEEAARVSPEPLSFLQAEYHPYLEQTKLLAACKRLGVMFIAYCPLARGQLLSDPALSRIAQTKGKTVAQVGLRWLMQQGISAIPRSSNLQRVAENFNVFDFQLSPAEMEAIAALKRAGGRVANPSMAPAWD